MKNKIKCLKNPKNKIAITKYKGSNLVELTITNMVGSHPDEYSEMGIIVDFNGLENILRSIEDV